MGLLNYMNTGRGLLGQRTPYQLQTMPQTPQQPQIAGTMPGAGGLSGNGWRSRMNGGGYQAGNSSPGGPGDASGVGGQGFGQGSQAGGFSTAQEMQNALYGPKPSDGNGSWYSGLIPGWRDAVGMAAGQVPGGGSAWSMAQLMANSNPSARDKAETGFSIMAGPLGGATKLADAYAGTQYARNHPAASYFNGGNADMMAANYADMAHRSGFGANQMASLYDAVNAERNKGGMGNPQAAADAWRMANMNDGQLHIGEPGFANPYATEVNNQGYIGDNSQGGLYAGADAGGNVISSDNLGPGFSVGTYDGGPTLGPDTTQGTDPNAGGDSGGGK